MNVRPVRSFPRPALAGALLLTFTAVLAVAQDDSSATTPATGSLAVLQIDGARAADLLARATAVDLAAGSPSAALHFAGMTAILYRHDAGMRLHLDRGLVDYAFDWMQASGALEP